MMARPLVIRLDGEIDRVINYHSRLSNMEYGEAMHDLIRRGAEVEGRHFENSRARPTDFAAHMINIWKADVAQLIRDSIRTVGQAPLESIDNSVKSLVLYGANEIYTEQVVSQVRSTSLHGSVIDFTDDE